MMRKSTVFISAVLTTFALVMLYRVAAAYNNNQNITQTAAQPTSIPAATATEVSAPAKVVLSPEEAAQLAAQVVGNTNLLSAESSNFNGLDAYLVTFTNNDVVYVGLDGQILAVQIAPMIVNNVPAVAQNQSQHVSSPSSEDHESDEDEHEEHDD